MNKKPDIRLLAYFGMAILVFALIVALDPDKSTELQINRNFTPGRGQFFRYVTHLGDGLIYAVILVLFLLFNYYAAIVTAFVIVLQTAIVQLMKNVVYPDALRPSAFFEQYGISLQYADGVEIHSIHSFPSGHTATAFAVAFLLSWYFRKNLLTLLFVVLASLAAFSRVYLMQHFFEDVLAGAVIGFISAVIVTEIIRRWVPAWSQNPNLQKGLLRRSSKD